MIDIIIKCKVCSEYTDPNKTHCSNCGAVLPENRLKGRNINVIKNRFLNSKKDGSKNSK